MDAILDLKDINTSTKEGRLLMGAIGLLTVEFYRDKTPWDVIEILNKCAGDFIHLDKGKVINQPTTAKSCSVDDPMDQFEDRLYALINKLSLENGSNTPDFIIAQFLRNVLEVWNNSVMQRSKYYSGRDRIDWKPKEMELFKVMLPAVEEAQDLLKQYFLGGMKMTKPVFKKRYVINLLSKILGGNVEQKIKEYNLSINKPVVDSAIKKLIDAEKWKPDPGAKVYVTRKGTEAMINTGRCGPAEKIPKFYKSGDRFIHVSSKQSFKLVTVCRGTEPQYAFLASEKTGRGFTGRFTSIKDSNRITENEFNLMRFSSAEEVDLNSSVHNFELIKK